MKRAETTAFNWDQRVSFSPSIREFIAKSRKSQTFYSNLEGAYGRRVFKREQKDSLQDYIESTLYYNVKHRDTDKNMKVKSIYRKITLVAQEFGFQEETHISAAWVYIFCFMSKRKLCVPVFKIYKSRGRDDAVFLSVDMTVHSSWDDYLENGNFGDAFLCVPRHGQYHFEEEESKLDLEFVTTRKARQEVQERYWSVDMYSPFCQTVVRPLITKMKELKNAVMKKIESIVIWLQDFWKLCGDGIMRAIGYAVVVLSYIFEFTSRPVQNLRKMISVGGLMLLNIKDENLTRKALPEANLNDEISLTAEYGILKLDFEDLVKEFKSICTAEKKNWKEILKIFCVLLVKARPMLQSLTALISIFVPEVGVVLTIVMEVIILAASLATSIWLKPPEESTGSLELKKLPSKSQGDQNVLPQADISSAPVVTLHSSQNIVTALKRLNTVGKTPRLNNSAEAFEDEEKVQRISVKDLWEGFGDLETVSACSIEKRAQSSAQSTKHTELAASLPYPAVNSVVVKDVNDSRILFMQNPNFPKLTSHIRHLLGTDILLAREDDLTFNVHRELSGENLGTLYFPHDSVVVALFPKKNLAVREENVTKILED